MFVLNIRWGILATGGIAHALASDLGLVEGAERFAVASRSLEKAEEFKKLYGFKKAYGSYDELINDKDIDAIYIATPNTFHKELSIKCLNAGKAVLCEKPVSMNLKEIEEVIECARKNNKFFMEAMWTRFLPVINEVKKIISEGSIGEIRLIQADFGFKAPYDPKGRIYNKELGGGALLDVGVYPISFATMLLKKLPIDIKSVACMSNTGVDKQVSMSLKYTDGEMASLTCAMNVETSQFAHIYGTKGKITLPYFFRAVKAYAEVDGKEFTIEKPFEGKGYNYEINEVMRCLREGKIESDIMPWKDSIAVMRLMDQIRKGLEID